MSDYYSNDLKKDIDESFDDLKSAYEETSAVVPEFLAFVQELAPKLDSGDAQKLEAFTGKISKINRNAWNGVEAMYSLKRNQTKIIQESRRDLEELELEIS